MVRCNICYRQKITAILLCKKKNNLPSIRSESGSVPRATILKSHNESHMLKECIKVDQLSKLFISEVHNTAPLDTLI